jgi:hypothetical protein
VAAHAPPRRGGVALPAGRVRRARPRITRRRRARRPGRRADPRFDARRPAHGAERRRPGRPGRRRDRAGPERLRAGHALRRFVRGRRRAPLLARALRPRAREPEPPPSLPADARLRHLAGLPRRAAHRPGGVRPLRARAAALGARGGERQRRGVAGLARGELPAFGAPPGRHDAPAHHGRGAIYGGGEVARGRRRAAAARLRARGSTPHGRRLALRPRADAARADRGRGTLGPLRPEPAATRLAAPERGQLHAGGGVRAPVAPAAADARRAHRAGRSGAGPQPFRASRAPRGRPRRGAGGAAAGGGHAAAAAAKPAAPPQSRSPTSAAWTSRVRHPPSPARGGPGCSSPRPATTWTGWPCSCSCAPGSPRCSS